MKNKLFLLLLIICLLCGCGTGRSAEGTSDLDEGTHASQQDTSADGVSSSDSSASDMVTRDNTPVVLVPSAPGIRVDENEYIRLDYSNSTEGYITATYLGSNEKVKLQITGPDDNIYTYNISTDPEVFPLTAGSGDYKIQAFEHVIDSQYSLVFDGTVTVSSIDEFAPYLYPNQYVWFTEDSAAVKKGAELASGCKDDIEVITSIYNYIISNITYDYDEAASVKSGYIPDVDSVLSSGRGICFDYASLTASMLRSQSIPTRLEIGYVGDTYHAWISTYVDEIGWVNGIIEFDGVNWRLMDPTFASSNSEKRLKEYIGDGSNYILKFKY